MSIKQRVRNVVTLEKFLLDMFDLFAFARDGNWEGCNDSASPSQRVEESKTPLRITCMGAYKAVDLPCGLEGRLIVRCMADQYTV